MAREEEVVRLPTGQFGYQKWLLTAQGREKLLNKPKVRRRSLPRIHAKEDA
jgi:DNA-directed RNA polymerase subunit H (RpoH/RPB5)